MMRECGLLLAIDTATDVASVAVRLPDRPPVAATRVGARRHAAELLPMIEEMLARTGVSFAALDSIAVSDGPGSFTGLRIGWAAAKGLVHERRIPLLTAPSLLGAAFAGWRASGSQADTTVAACYDALRGQVFAALYQFAPGRATAIVPPALMTVAELARLAPSRPPIVVTDGAEVVVEQAHLWTGGAPLALTSGHSREPIAAALCELDGWHGGLEPIPDPATREPVYGRPAEAQVKWEARHGRPLPNPTGSAR
jgi:tRNA threonylcarbamoyladenosine biosynthesis protein TsaB